MVSVSCIQPFGNRLSLIFRIRVILAIADKELVVARDMGGQNRCRGDLQGKNDDNQVETHRKYICF